MLRKLEILANLVVIVTALLLCAVVAKKYLFPPSTQAPAPISSSSSSNSHQRAPIRPGTGISLPGIDWKTSGRTVLLALSTSCHFCSESAPFYIKLQQQKPASVRVVAVLPQSVEASQSYLAKLGISSVEVVQMPLASVGVSGTPTVILVDQNGVIEDSWVGKLSDNQAEELLARIMESKQRGKT